MRSYPLGCNALPNTVVVLLYGFRCGVTTGLRHEWVPSTETDMTPLTSTGWDLVRYTVVELHAEVEHTKLTPRENTEP